MWLKPLCHHFKSKVPGGLFLTDVMMYLDVLIGGNLLCKPGVEKVAQAADEAKRLKRLMGALRYLWRNSALEGRKSIFFWSGKCKCLPKNCFAPVIPFPHCTCGPILPFGVRRLQSFPAGHRAQAHVGTVATLRQSFFTVILEF